MKSLQQRWYSSASRADVLLWLLLPISWLYCAVASVRRKFYQLNIKQSYAGNAPLVVIGNIVVGGSGKTPLIISVCKMIQQKGYKPGVVSRGYGGKFVGIKQVVENDSAEIVGDEPLMISQRTGVPVVVGADRVAAVKYLLENNHCDIVLSDDGLQHYRMQRDLEIAVVDANRGFGNAFCLPAGPLREPVARLQEVDLVVYNGSKNTDDEDNNNTCSYHLKIIDLCPLLGGDSTELSFHHAKKIHAIAGIGNPARFFSLLRDQGLDVIEHAFADHHFFQQSDFSEWQNSCIIMTEKDAVKCQHLSLPDAWVLRVSAELSETLEADLVSKIMPLLVNETAQS